MDIYLGSKFLFSGRRASPTRHYKPSTTDEPCELEQSFRTAIIGSHGTLFVNCLLNLRMPVNCNECVGCNL